ncbi:MAG: DMT family transporter [Planctomycetota bacterium]
MSAHLGELAAAGTAILWTLSTLAWTSAGRHVGALAVSFLRLVITCGFLFVHQRLARGLWIPTDVPADVWTILGISGFVGFFLSDLLLFKAFLLIGPRLSLLIYSITPPTTAIIAWIYLDNELGAAQWIGMAVTLAGVAWVVLERPREGLAEPAWRVTPMGLTLAVVSAILQAVSAVLAKEGAEQTDPVAATFIRVAPAIVGYSLLVTLLGRWPAMVAAWRHPRAIWIMSLGALVGPYLGVVLYMLALKHSPAGVVTTITATMPVLILPFAIVLYKEHVSPRAALGAVVCVAGIALLVAR